MEKKIERGRDRFVKYKKLIYILIKIINIFPLNFRIKLFNYFRKVKGNKGIALRFVLLKTIAKSCGDNVVIQPDVYLFNVENIVFGKNVSTHPMSYIEGAGGVEIGNDVSIAHGVSILSTTHNFERIDIVIKDQGISKKKTIIEDNVWIGAKSSILYGVTIHSGSIVAANSVVNKSCEVNSVVGGIPAKLIRKRTVSHL